MERNNVLLKITDLRQYFPVGKKKGLYVKANDGISLNIYEGETVGLVGESGCGKSTFGRTLLQLYRQTDGKTMYYGASRDELAPEYIEKTIRHLPHGLHELAALEKKRDEMQKVYDAADEQKRLHMHNDLTAAKKAANDAYLNIVNVIGGFITAKDLGPVMKIFSERHDRCCDLHKAIEKRAPVKLDYDEEAFKLSKLKAGERGYDSRKGKLDKLAEKVAEHDKLVEAARAEIAKVDARIDAMRAKYAADPEFQKHEALLDNGIDLARLTYPEVRTLRCQMQYIFQDPYSSLNPRMTVANIIGEGLLAHKYCKKANERMHEEILQTFERERVPILLGTQMVAKGLDFENVTLVGVLSADISLYVDNYQAAERTFSLLTQVVGRAGRGGKTGRAVIQTYTPGNDVIRCAARQDYDAFYESEIRMRRLRRYPPFADLFTVTVSGTEEGRVLRAAVSVRETLRQLCRRPELAAGEPEVLGPAPAPVVKVNNRFRYRCTLVGKNDKATREMLAWLQKDFAKDSANRGMNLFVDHNAAD